MSAIVGRKRCRCKPSAYSWSGTMLEVAASVTPRANRPANRLPSSIASAMSVTANSSKQMIRVSLAISAATISSGFSTLRWCLSRSCTAAMKRWKCCRRFSWNGRAVEEQIHHECLAAPDAAPEIEAADRLAALAGELRDLAAPTAWRRCAQQVAVQALERLDRAHLRRVGRELAAVDALPIEGEGAGHTFSSGRSTK